MVLGPGATGPAQKPDSFQQHQLTHQAESYMNDVNEAALVIDTEAAAISQELKAETKKDTMDARNVQEKDSPNRPEKIAEQMAAIITEDEIEDKRKADESKLEEKMAKLEEMEGMIDQKNVDGEDKGVVEKFFDNMSRIRNLRKQLKQLQQEEQFYIEQVKEEEKRQKKKEFLEKEKKRKDEEQKLAGNQNNDGHQEKE